VLSRQAIHALKALLELAAIPSAWRSVNELAAAQALPAPMLEQLLLRLRRARLLEARRGRTGGYRLALPAAEIPLTAVLAALNPPPGALRELPVEPQAGSVLPQAGTAPPEQVAADRVAAVLNQRLRRALERELERCTLADLLHDLRSTRASLSEEGGLLIG
jgi:Rrf2 family iron-sulfur cluster assembly transcriptional regulator